MNRPKKLNKTKHAKNSKAIACLLALDSRARGRNRSDPALWQVNFRSPLARYPEKSEELRRVKGGGPGRKLRKGSVQSCAEVIGR